MKKTPAIQSNLATDAEKDAPCFIAAVDRDDANALFSPIALRAQIDRVLDEQPDLGGEGWITDVVREVDPQLAFARRDEMRTDLFLPWVATAMLYLQLHATKSEHFNCDLPVQKLAATIGRETGSTMPEGAVIAAALICGYAMDRNCGEPGAHFGATCFAIEFDADADRGMSRVASRRLAAQLSGEPFYAGLLGSRADDEAEDGRVPATRRMSRSSARRLVGRWLQYRPSLARRFVPALLAVFGATTMDDLRPEHRQRFAMHVLSQSFPPKGVL